MARTAVLANTPDAFQTRSVSRSTPRRWTLSRVQPLKNSLCLLIPTNFLSISGSFLAHVCESKMTSETEERARQAALIERASHGDVEAFSRLVREYQDMAVGYAISLLGDFHAAEDAAQEAFVGLFQKLGELRNPVAFPAWFRSIVRTACSRSTRGRLQTVQLEGDISMEEEETNDGDEEVMAVVRSLAETERAVIALHYMSRYSHRDISRFLEIPETTVQSRLRSGRKHLKERMLAMARERLGRHAPSGDSRFADRVKRLVRPETLKSEEEQVWAGGRGTDVWEMLTAAIRGDLGTIEKLVKDDPNLVNCRYQYRTPLHFSVQENHIDVAKFLLEKGVDASEQSGNIWHERPLTIAHERGYVELHQLLQDHLEKTVGVAEGGERIAAAIRERDVDAVRRLLDGEPDLVHAADERGNMPIHWAVMIRSMPMISLVLEKEGDINAMRPDGARPLDLTRGDYFYRAWQDVPARALTTHEVLIGYLVALGAEYDIAVAAKIGHTERVRQLLEQDASLANAVPAYSTNYSGLPLRNACGKNDLETVKVLLDFGADPSTPEPGVAPKGMALYGAAANGNVEMARMLLERGADPNASVESSGTCMTAAGDNAQMLKLLASYGGEFSEFADLSRIPSEALEAVYGEILPLRYYVDSGDLATLTARLDHDPDIAGEILQLAVRLQRMPMKPLIRLCLDQDPSSARQIHANDLIYDCLRKVDDEEEMLEVFAWLFEAGMTPNDSDWLRVSSLHRLALGNTQYGTDGSIYKPYPKTLRLFTQVGADLDAKDEEYHSTSLGWAARWGRKEAVELLLKGGAKTNLPDDLPWATSLAWAQKKGHKEVERILKEAGATA